MKKVLVTGANGHLGYTLVQSLLRRGYACRKNNVLYVADAFVVMAKANELLAKK